MRDGSRRQVSEPGTARYGGVLIQDVDGTLNVPGEKGVIHRDVIKEDARYVSGGGTLIISTNRPQDWVEEKLVQPIASRMRSQQADWKARSLESLMLMPEQGSVLLTLESLTESDDSLRFSWKEEYSTELPERGAIEAMLSSSLLPKFPGSRLRPGTRRIVSVERFPVRGDSEKAEKYLENIKASGNYPGVPWDSLRFFSTQSTLTFVNAAAGKEEAVRKAIELFPGKFMSGPCFGFGNDGDSFASVVPTFNVGERGAFAGRGLPELIWGEARILKEGEYASEKEGTPAEEVLLAEGGAVDVLRLKDGSVLRTSPLGGHPIQLLPPRRGRRRKAGRATAAIMAWLMDAGFLSGEA